MDNSKGDTSNYVRSAYRRPESRRPHYRKSKGKGRVWSVIIVLLLIVILAGGAVWIYLSRQGGGPEIASTETEAQAPKATASGAAGSEETSKVASAGMENEASAPQTTASAAAGSESGTPPGNANADTAAAPSEGASQGQSAEDEFAAILRELGINDTGKTGQEEKVAGAEAGAPENASKEGQPEMMAQEKTEKAAGQQQQQESAVASAPTTQEEGAPQEPSAVASIPESSEAPGAGAPPTTAEFTPENAETPEEAPSAVADTSGESAPQAPTTNGGERESPMEAPSAVAGVDTSEGAMPAFGESTPQGTNANTVVVQPGDSLSRIAQRVYGNPGKWRLIYEANQDVLENPDRLLVGMELTIPPEQ